MLEHQEQERLKNEAYSISTIVFPKVRKRLDDHFEMNIAKFFHKYGFGVSGDLIEYYTDNQLESLFNDYEIHIGFETFEKIFPSKEIKGREGIKAAFLLQIVESNFKIVEKCIERAPELSSYLYDEKLKKAFGCYLAYERGCTGGKNTEFAKKCRIAGFPIIVGDNYGIEKMWYELGKRVVKPAK
ncbi:hypothetical protein RO22_17895 [Halomonas sp. KHS3]|jgi:hypothetical protein|nr:hypothetical protein RO22_17895 [Halomonas sp. KHS3]